MRTDPHAKQPYWDPDKAEWVFPQPEEPPPLPCVGQPAPHNLFSPSPRDDATLRALLAARSVQPEAALNLDDATYPDLDPLAGLLGPDENKFILESLKRAHAIRALRAPAQPGDPETAKLTLRYHEKNQMTWLHHEIPLTPSRYRLIFILTANAGHVVSHFRLYLALTLGFSEPEPQQVGWHLHHLRSACNVAEDPLPLTSVSGRGYILELQPDQVFIDAPPDEAYLADNDPFSGDV